MYHKPYRKQILSVWEAAKKIPQGLQCPHRSAGVGLPVWPTDARRKRPLIAHQAVYVEANPRRLARIPVPT
jgi:hypothetical protein